MCGYVHYDFHRVTSKPFYIRRKLFKVSSIACPLDVSSEPEITSEKNTAKFRQCYYFVSTVIMGWLGSPVVSVLDSGAEGPGFK